MKKPPKITADVHDLLECFKRDERKGSEVAAAFLHDFRLAILVVHWSDVRNVPTRDEVALGGFADWWEALWGNVITDFDQVCVMLDCDYDQAISLVDRVATLRLVYPDGSTNAMALLVARAMITRELKERTGLKV